MNSPNNTRRIVFVSRQLGPDALRSAQAIRKLDGVLLFGIGESSSDTKARVIFADFVRVNDTHDRRPGQAFFLGASGAAGASLVPSWSATAAANPGPRRQFPTFI